MKTSVIIIALIMLAAVAYFVSTPRYFDKKRAVKNVTDDIPIKREEQKADEQKDVQRIRSGGFTPVQVSDTQDVKVHDVTALDIAPGVKSVLNSRTKTGVVIWEGV